MNLSWMLFVVEGNSVAAGGVASNIFRLLSILLAVILTHFCSHKFKKSGCAVGVGA